VSQANDPPENGHSNDVSQPGEDELARRLRDLSWPASSPELRERCWEDFRRRLEDRSDDGDRGEQSRSSERRLDFRRRETVGGTPVIREREAIAHFASRRR
jgi:hypothetical protein